MDADRVPQWVKIVTHQETPWNLTSLSSSCMGPPISNLLFLATGAEDMFLLLTLNLKNPELDYLRR